MKVYSYCQIEQSDIVHMDVVQRLHQQIIGGANSEEALWQVVVAYQQHQFFTSSGLPFSYTLRRNKKGEYTAELLISRKEGSKTLTRSSVMLAFNKVLEAIEIQNECQIVLPEYKGPKAIGQIFGISYIYSMFYELELIRIPADTAAKISGKSLENKQKPLDI